MAAERVAVLLTGVGKRYDIVSAFAEHAFVIAADPNPLAPARYAADLRGVAGGGEGRRVTGDRERVRGERAHDVVALADAREDYAYALGFHPPLSPL